MMSSGSGLSANWPGAGHEVDALESVTAKFTGGNHQAVPYVLAGDA